MSRKPVSRLIGAVLFLLMTVATRAFPMPETYTYKTVGSLEIKADVYRPVPAKGKHPVAIYIHGGSLINGGREKMEKTERIIDRYVAAGFIGVSIDYRLAPESKLPQIVEDLTDAYRWVREQGPALFGADPDRIAVTGASAGGYLTLVAGYWLTPRPFALVAESSYGDLIGDWVLGVSRSPKHQQANGLTAAQAWQQVAGPPIANAVDRKGEGGVFNAYLRTHGLWPKAISGWDPKTEGEKFLPYMPLKHVTAAYPPTMLIHGEKDSDVTVELPKRMAAELERAGVEHKLIIIPGGEHGYVGGDPQLIADAQRQAVAFLVAHLPK